VSAGATGLFSATYLPPVLVTIVAAVLALVAFHRFLESPRQLWTSVIHDRNAHYYSAQSLGLNLRHEDLVGVLRDLDGARVWGPLHPVLTGFVLAVTGPDYRVAVLPSLAAWVASAVLVYLVARRSLNWGGNLAGATAVIFFLASPAYQAFAVDIMLEGFGAGLTLLALYCCLRVVQENTVAAARALGLALTALFLLKYNYWLLVLLALGIVLIWTYRASWLPDARSALRSISWKPWLIAQARHPVNYVIVVVAAALIIMVLKGGSTLTLAGKAISVRSADNLATAVYALVFLRMLPWWWRRGRQWLAGLSYPLPQLATWHGVPVVLWFLWPKRVSNFVWYLTCDHGSDVERHDMGAAAAYYWHCLGSDYHAALWSLVLATCLASVAVLAWRRLRPGGAAVLLFVLIAAVLAVRYPSHRSRHLHSWLAVGWAVAGMGLALLACNRLTRRFGWVQPCLAAVALIALWAVHMPCLFQAGHAPEGGPKADRPSVLDLTDRIQPTLANSSRPAVFCNVPGKFLCWWTAAEHPGRRRRPETELRGDPTAEAFPTAFAHWLDTTSCDAIIYIDLPPGSAFYEGVSLAGYEKAPRLLAGQSAFRLVERQTLPECGCRFSVWRRR
jgi:hypothetical protein